MKCILIGQYVPEALGIEGYSRAGNNYQSKLIKFIQPTTKRSVFPYFFKVEYNTNLCHDEFYYSKKRLKSHGLYFFKSIIWGIVQGFKLSEDIVIYYNFNPYYLGFILSSFIQRKKQLFIIADYWQKNKWMQYLQDSIVRKSIGVVALNENIKLHSNIEYLYGLVEETILPIQNCDESKLRFLFSGSLGHETGFGLCLEFFKNNPEYELHISGFPFGDFKYDFDKLIKELKSYKNIFYHGALDRKSYEDLLASVNVCFSLRDVNDIQSKYNFPSKILEYLSFGKYVISSMAYPKLVHPLFVTSGFSVESIKKSILDIENMDKQIWNKEKYFIDWQKILYRDFGEKALIEKISVLLKNRNINL